MKKSQTNFHSTGTLERYDSRDSIETQVRWAKVSKVSAEEDQKRREFDGSVVTNRIDTKVEDSISRAEETTTLLSLQIKIDDLEEKLFLVREELNQCKGQL